MSKALKHTQEFIRKRQLMVFIPIPGVICLTLLFFLGGGGKGVPTAMASTGTNEAGINTSLPSAGKSALFENKMDAYKAPQDSSHYNGLAFTPVGDATQPTDAAAAPESMGSTAEPAPGGMNYAVQPGESPQRYNPNYDPNVAAVQSRMQRIQQQQTAHQQPSYPRSGGGYANGGYSSAANYAPAPSAKDVQMEQTLRELDDLRQQYEKRLQALNAPTPAAPAAAVAPAPIATSAALTKQEGMSVVTEVPQSVVTSLGGRSTLGTAVVVVNSGNAFHGLGSDNGAGQLNAVPAVIHDDQVVSQGSTVKMRLLSDVQVEGRLIPRNSFLYGTCDISGNRLTIEATSVQYQNSVIPLSLHAYDMDGGEGLSIPGSVNRDAAKQGMANGASSADLLTMSPSLGAQAAGIALQTGKTLAGRKIKLVKIHLKANYKLLLKS
ncbi:conjugative transposon protein TraM [Hymenobacter defluvii]|uniref:Conjugative transposon protein TraM n=1 Tax=Hymenobacter defluvii TaxID=2054411 RepID=A0ABS3TH55_9BACT|nr:conjugative transposon protein TraM [Hymenobacter defluvii]MBO3272958.1 conjugative transposon protein TraM [Hymenobacter defluvii]